MLLFVDLLSLRFDIPVQASPFNSMILNGGLQPELAESELGWTEKSFKEDHDVSPRYADAFGDEENAEVKYKTMEWW